MIIPKVVSFKNDLWGESVTQVIASIVNEFILKKGTRPLILTGGNTAKFLYKFWRGTTPWDHSKVIYYFGDERCFLPGHKDSNYKMAINSLFSNGVVPAECQVERIRDEVVNLESEVYRYISILPKSIDVLLLSVGLDRHIASLFPNSEFIQERNQSLQ